MHATSIFMAAAALASMALADCNVANKLDVEVTAAEDQEQLCLPQGEGSWTFAMEVSETVFPTFSAQDPWAGYSASKGFSIYDNSCILKAVYDPQQDNDCGSPYVIQENFLPYVLTVTSVDFNSADPFFGFTYGDGYYSIGENGCVCSDIGDGLQVRKGCRCAFPLDGMV